MKLLCVRNVFVTHEACSLLSFLRNASDSGGRTEGGGRALGGFSPPREVKVWGGLSPPQIMKNPECETIYTNYEVVKLLLAG